jgi:hypothetical protein
MDVVTLARSLGARRFGDYWMARCPAHADQNPSLSIAAGRNGTVLVHCFGGCEQDRVIQALVSLGLWVCGRTEPCSSVIHKSRERGNSTEVRTSAALQVWEASHPAEGTLVEAYLASRGLRITAPTSLRFHPALKHPSGHKWPVMVAAVTRGSDTRLVGIHRTFLAHDGMGKASVDNPKMMLGPCRSGAVQLARASDLLLVGEGIETCLAAMQATGLPAWAALSTTGLVALELPPTICRVIVLADGDEPGEAAAKLCSRRWTSEGRSVSIARAPKGQDFNDVLFHGLPERSGT